MRQNIPYDKFDRPAALMIILLILILFSAIQIIGQKAVTAENKTSGKINDPGSPQAEGDKIEFKNGSGNSILIITDEGSNAGSITIPESTPSNTSDKLYNEGGTLKFNGSSLNSGGASELDDLTDAKFDGTHLFIGLGAGDSDDGTSSAANTALGRNALNANINSGSNTAVGNSALLGITGSGNTALGNFALAGGGSSKNASQNVAIGSSALRFVDEGSNNVAVGNSSLSYVANGNYNTSVGNSAFAFGTTGSNNVSIGYSADAFGEGSNNTIIGYQAGYYNNPNSKSGSVFIGYQAGYYEATDNKLYIENSNTANPLIWGDFTNNDVKINGDFHVTGNITADGDIPGINELDDLNDAKTLGNSVFLGSGAGANDDGSDNKNYGFGINSLGSNTSGYANAAMGFNAMFFNTEGIQNVGLGQGSLYSNTTGDNNVAVGYHSNHFNQTGSNNTMLGYQAGRGASAHSKSGNIFIGYQAGYNETGNNKLYIDNSSSASPLIWGDFNNNDIQINGDFHVTGNITADGAVPTDNDWDDGIDAGAMVLYNPSLRVGIGTNGATLEPKLHVKGDEGVLFEGTFDNGSALALGAGTRFHFYPKKSALRAGYVSNDQWDDANIGNYSISLGTNTTASGWSSAAFGYGTTASGSYSTALGYSSEAIGSRSVAIGFLSTASGASSTSIGHYISTNSFDGSFIIGDNSTTTVTNSTANHQLMTRFSGGYIFYSNSGLTTGVYMNANASGWTNISDRNKKENFKEIEGEDLLKKIRNLPVTKWNYKNSDPNIKYIGPMAQDFHKIFGLGGTDSLGINSIAIDGVNIAGIKALEERTMKQKELIQKLENRIRNLEKHNDELLVENLNYKKLKSEFEKRLIMIERKVNDKIITTSIN